MALILAPFLFIGAVLYVAWPLIREGKMTISIEEVGERARILQEKEEIIESLKDIEMDFRMDKLSLTDYRSLKNEFEHRAVGILQRLESVNKKGTHPRKKR